MDNYYNLNDADNIIGTIALKYKPIKGLEITSRIGNNFVLNNSYESVPVYAYESQLVLIDRGNGVLIYDDRDRANNSNIGEYSEGFSKINALDFNNLAAYTKEWEKFKLGITGGVNITDFSTRTVSGSTQGGLIVPNFYNLSNSVETPQASNAIGQNRTIRTYGTASFGLFNTLNLDYSFANEWSSASCWKKRVLLSGCWSFFCCI